MQLCRGVKQGRMFLQRSWGTALCRDTHCCDPPIPAVRLLPVRKNSLSSGPCTRELQNTGPKSNSCGSWVGFQGGCLCVSSCSWRTAFCCSCLQSTQGSASLCRFSPNLCVQGRCPCVELAAREAPSLSLPYSRAPLD